MFEPITVKDTKITRNVAAGLEQPMLACIDALTEAGKYPFVDSLVEVLAVLQHYKENVNE